MVKEILIELSNDDNSGAMIVRPATSHDLALCQKEMLEFAEGNLPSGYVEFLKIVNGFAWNGIQFYSTDEVTDPEDEFVLIDIVSANQDFQDREIEGNKVLLGRSDIDLYVYNPENKKYETLDFTAGDVMDEYDSFEALFKEIVGERMGD